VAAEGRDEDFVGGPGYCVVLWIGLSILVVGRGEGAYMELIVSGSE
jgi:hypothetical protein